MNRSTWILVAVAAILSGCSFFEDRVRAHDERIETLEQELSVLPPGHDEERAMIIAEIEKEKAARDRALEGVQQEGANRQAMLMAAIALGSGVLKVATGIAKGA